MASTEQVKMALAMVMVVWVETVTDQYKKAVLVEMATLHGS